MGRKEDRETQELLDRQDFQGLEVKLA